MNKFFGLLLFGAALTLSLNGSTLAQKGDPPSKTDAPQLGTPTPKASDPDAAKDGKAPSKNGEAKDEQKKSDEKKEKTPVEIADEKASDALTKAVDAQGKGDIAWMLVSTAFVMLMVPGLALFYGGMVRGKNVLATMMQSMICLSVVGVFWIAIGYSLAFGDPWLKIGETGILGWSSELVFLRGVTTETLVPTLNIPVYLHMAYQGMFAIITPALISGALAERIKFKSYLVFVLLWMVVVYCPLAQSVWAFNWNWGYTLMAEPNGLQLVENEAKAKTESEGKPDDAKLKKAAEDATAKLEESKKKLEERKAAYVKAKVDAAPEAVRESVKSDYETGSGKKASGYLGEMGALDFAGGTVVHIAAGLSSLAAFLALRKRYGYPEHAFHPNSMVLTLTGAGILWFGWFGFNGGSGLASGALAVSAFTATQAAAAGAGLSWVLVEWLHRGKPTALGFASGVVAGLVAVTPAAGFVVAWAGLAIGLIAGAVCYCSVFLKSVFKYDDSLDAFGVHGVGGFLGAMLTGVFCWWPVNHAIPNNGFYYATEDRFKQLGIQFVAAAFSVVLAFVASFILVKLIDALMGFTVTAAEETTGLDQIEHGETGFDFGLAHETMALSFEPKAARVPPDSKKRFSVVVEGLAPDKIAAIWGDLCQPTKKPSADFLAVYPKMTLLSGNKFKFIDGNPEQVSAHLAKVLQASANGGSVKTIVEK